MRNLVFNALEKPLANGEILAPNGVAACVGFIVCGVQEEKDVVSRIPVGVVEVGCALDGDDRIFLRMGQEDARTVRAGGTSTVPEP